MHSPHSHHIPLCLLVIACSVAAVAQPKQGANSNQQSNNTLLWRISGKGLRHHSYLFGTYHTRDPRAFRFTDSMVAAFGRCAAFFGELHLDSAARDFYQDYRNEAPVDLPTLFASATLRPEYSIPQTYEWGATPFGGIDENITDNFYPVFLDAWLFRHAQLQGKHVGGLEELATQLEEFLHDRKEPQRTSKTEKKTEADEGRDEGKKDDNSGLALVFLRYMQEGQVDFYANQDLESIQQTINWTKKVEGGRRAMEAMLDHRNIGMAQRIDSLVWIAPSFITMGCAHLMGTNGVVAMLRNKGYTVTPVHSAKTGATIAAGTTRLTRNDWGAYPVFHGAATINLPLQPVSFLPYPRKENQWGGQLSITPDVGSGVNYFLAELTLPPHQLVTNWPKLMRACLATLSDSSSQLTIGEVIPDPAAGTAALTVTATSPHLRARLVARGNRLYLLLAAADTDLPNDDSSGVDRFFRSFQFAPAAAASGWETIRFDTGRCAVQLPSKPHLFETSPDQIAPTPAQQGAMAERDGTVFTITVAPIRSYTRYQTDSAQMVNEIFGLRSLNHSSLPTIVLDSLAFASNSPRLRFTLTNEQGGVRGMIVRHGMFQYLLTASNSAAMPPPGGVDSFFTSLQILPPVSLRWRPFSSVVLGFKGEFPGEPILSDELGYWTMFDEATSAVVHDTLNGGRYTVEACLLNRYLRLPAIDSLFQSEVHTAYTRDTILWSGPIEQGGEAAREYIYGQAGHISATRYRLVQQGRQVFLISYFGNRAHLRDSSVDRFFNSFRAMEKAEQWEMAADKVPQFFGDLLAEQAENEEADSNEELESAAQKLLQRNNAIVVLGLAPRHVPLLYAAIDSLLGMAQLHGLQERAVGTLVAWLGSTNDTATPQFLRDRYSSLPDESARTSALRALIDIGTTQSLQTLGELLLKPSGPDASELYDLSTAGIDSGTTGALYPAILSLLEIESYQEPLYRLTSLALDSGIITPETLIPHRQLLLSSFSAHLGELASNGDTEESRMELGWKLTALIDCLGHLPAAADMDTLLLQCATQADVPIATAAAAAIALLQHGVAADTPAITNVLQKYAAQPENRAWLYRWMASNGVVEHFPRAFQTPVLFAESNLAEWLEADDGPPTFIELLAERNIRWEGKDGVGYLFRFTWDSSAAEASWNAGLVVGDPAASLANQPDPEPTVRYEYESLEELTNDEKIQYFLIRE